MHKLRLIQFAFLSAIRETRAKRFSFVESKINISRRMDEEGSSPSPPLAQGYLNNFSSFSFFLSSSSNCFYGENNRRRKKYIKGIPGR